MMIVLKDALLDDYADSEVGLDAAADIVIVMLMLASTIMRMMLTIIRMTNIQSRSCSSYILTTNSSKA